jgi:hypothetical protein
MDSNARSKMWHDVLTNKRGRKLEEFVIGNQIHIVNEDSKLTTFEPNRGTSNVNLTTADNKTAFSMSVSNVPGAFSMLSRFSISLILKLFLISLIKLSSKFLKPSSLVMYCIPWKL